MRHKFDTPKKKKKVGRMSFDINKSMKGEPTSGEKKIVFWSVLSGGGSEYLGLARLQNFKLE